MCVGQENCTPSSTTTLSRGPGQLLGAFVPLCHPNLRPGSAGCLSHLLGCFNQGPELRKSVSRHVDTVWAGAAGHWWRQVQKLNIEPRPHRAGSEAWAHLRGRGTVSLHAGPWTAGGSRVSKWLCCPQLLPCLLGASHSLWGN